MSSFLLINPDLAAYFERYRLFTGQLFEHPDCTIYLTAGRTSPVAIAFLGFLMKKLKLCVAAFGTGNNQNFLCIHFIISP